VPENRKQCVVDWCLKKIILHLESTNKDYKEDILHSTHGVFQ